MNQLDMFTVFTTVGNTVTVNTVPRITSIEIARQKRDAGIKQVSANNREFLDIMRAVAKQICWVKGWVCSDDLREHADCHGIKPTHYNAWGAVLTVKEFIPGKYVVSKQPQGHANRVRRWTLRATA